MTKIGIDIDHTVLDYSESINMLSRCNSLLKGVVLREKEELKHYVTENHGGEVWTELQGELYGKYINYANLYPGVLESLACFESVGISWYLVSHKTEFPIRGYPFPLRRATFRRLVELQLISHSNPQQNVFFFDTKSKKIEFINDYGFDFFIDDLPEILEEVSHPIYRILFRSMSQRQGAFDALAKSWTDVRSIVVGK